MQLLSRFLQSAAIHSFVTKFSRTKNLTIKGTITGIQKSALYPRFNKTPLLIGCRLSCVLHFSKRSTFSVSVREKVILSQRSKSMVLMILCLILCYNRNDSWIQILWESYFSCSPNFPSIRLDEVRETIHHFLITPGKLRILAFFLLKEDKFHFFAIKKTVWSTKLRRCAVQCAVYYCVAVLRTHRCLDTTDQSLQT